MATEVQCNLQDYGSGTPLLQLYNNDGDLTADVTVVFVGSYAPEGLQVSL